MPNIRRYGFVLVLILTLALLPPKTGRALKPSTITILRPRSGSSVTAPIEISAEVQTDPGGLIRIALIDRNGNDIARKLLRVGDAAENELLNFTTQLLFEIPTENSEALLTVTAIDQANRPIALRSVILNLQSDGITTLTDQTSPEPWITLSEPQPLEVIDGGRIRVTGKITPLTEKPITFDLIMNDGLVIGSTLLAVERPGEPLDFQINLYYAFITTVTDARLVIRQTINPYGTDAILDSLLITLNP